MLLLRQCLVRISSFNSQNKPSISMETEELFKRMTPIMHLMLLWEHTGRNAVLCWWGDKDQGVSERVLPSLFCLGVVVIEMKSHYVFQANLKHILLPPPSPDC